MRASGTDGAPTVTSSIRYQIGLTLLLSLNFGIVTMDRASIAFVMPFVQPDLNLNNTQIGLLASGLSLSWALAALAAGRLSDVCGGPKRLLVLGTLTFSVFTALGGFVTGFLSLLATRILLGMAEGVVLPISQTLIAVQVDPKRRGLAQGLAQTFGASLLGFALAPLLIVALASAHGWRTSLVLIGLPGFISALVLAWFVSNRGTSKGENGPSAKRDSFRETFKLVRGNRNIVICAVLFAMNIAFLTLCIVFMPMYLVKEANYLPKDMGILLASIGLSCAVLGFVVPALSDRIGRRPIIVAMYCVGVALPIAVMFFHGEIWTLAALIFLGMALHSAISLVFATVPSESVEPRQLASVLGFVMCAGELLGGVLVPAVAGVSADMIGLQAPMWILVAIAIGCGMLALERFID